MRAPAGRPDRLGAAAAPGSVGKGSPIARGSAERQSGALGRRVLSAAVGLPVLAAAVMLGWPATAAVALVAALAAGWEVAGLAAARGVARAALTLLPPAAVAGGIGVAAESRGFAAGSEIAAGAAVVVAVLVAVAGLYRATAGALSPASAASTADASATGDTASRGRVVGERRRDPFRYLAIAAALYFGIALGFAAPTSASLALARDADTGFYLPGDGRLWLAFAILVTFAVDTAAYFTGRAIGRRKMAPSISPGKTWEGTAGGLAAGTAAGAALAVMLEMLAGAIDASFGINPAIGAALGLAMGVAAVLGDLAESWLKRRAGAKDAGSLIPGHGGFLDRLDSLAPNLAIVYYARIWAGG